MPVILAVLGVVGPHNSGCAGVQIPIANQAPGGALAMISPSNTSTGLTRPDPGERPDEHEGLYPSGERNFVRIAAADHLQAVAGAQLVEELGARRLFVLSDPYFGTDVATAARNLGLEVVGSTEVERRGSELTSASPDASPGLAPTRSSSAASSIRTGAPWFGISAPASVPTWRSSPPTTSAPSRI